jgi:hypothetical protein
MWSSKQLNAKLSIYSEYLNGRLIVRVFDAFGGAVREASSPPSPFCS